MGDPNPFAPSGKLAFLTGLTASTMDTFKKQHDDQQAEDRRQKEIDYQILMNGLEVMKPNLTPSQAKEILTRATDIFKPKGHSGIKDQLHQLFGGGEPYNPQAGNILAQAAGRPKLSVAMPTQTATPGGEGADQVRARTVSLPAPPQSIAEPTYREQGLQDEQAKYGFQLDKALAIQEAHAATAKDQIRLRNDLITKRHMDEFGLKNDAKAQAQIDERAALLGDPSDPDVRDRARVQLLAELGDKRDLSKSRIALNQRRLTEIDDKLKIAQQKVNATGGKGGIKYKDDPQWKGMWAKANADASAAKLLRTQAAIAHSKFNTEGDDGLLKQATDLEGQAQQIEDDMAKQLSGMEDRQHYLSTGQMPGVKLPNPPGGTRRGGAKLTEAEIRANGGNDATVQRARQRGLLAP